MQGPRPHLEPWGLGQLSVFPHTFQKVPVQACVRYGERAPQSEGPCTPHSLATLGACLVPAAGGTDKKRILL